MERKFSLIRLSSGDYLLPGNDGQTLYRLQRYTEHGDGWWMVGEKEVPIVGDYWAAYEYDRKLTSDADLVDDMLDWHHWSCVASVQKTRKDAIEAVIR